MKRNRILCTDGSTIYNVNRGAQILMVTNDIIKYAIKDQNGLKTHLV